MDAQQLRDLQAPVKERYRESPQSAIVTLHSTATLDQDRIVCRVATGQGNVDAGLHPAAGGDGSGACSGDMLLDALVACAGVTLTAVATAMNIEIRSGTIEATGEMDFRGTLGVEKGVPVGITSVRLHFSLETDAAPEQIEKLVKLTERYCVIYQTLQQPPSVSTSFEKVDG